MKGKNRIKLLTASSRRHPRCPIRADQLNRMHHLTDKHAGKKLRNTGRKNSNKFTFKKSFR